MAKLAGYNRPSFYTQIVQFLETALWAQRRSLAEEGINELHISILRRVSVAKTLATAEVRGATGASKEEMCRAVKFLQKSDLLCASRRPENKREQELCLRPRGQSLMDKINEELEASFLRLMGIRSIEAKPIAEFTRNLWKVNGMLPASGAIEHRAHQRIDVVDDSPRYAGMEDGEIITSWGFKKPGKRGHF